MSNLLYLSSYRSIFIYFCHSFICLFIYVYDLICAIFTSYTIITIYNFTPSFLTKFSLKIHWKDFRRPSCERQAWSVHQNQPLSKGNCAGNFPTSLLWQAKPLASHLLLVVPSLSLCAQRSLAGLVLRHLEAPYTKMQFVLKISAARQWTLWGVCFLHLRQ